MINFNTLKFLKFLIDFNIKIFLINIIISQFLIYFSISKYRKNFTVLTLRVI